MEGDVTVRVAVEMALKDLTNVELAAFRICLEWPDQKSVCASKSWFPKFQKLNIFSLKVSAFIRKSSTLSVPLSAKDFRNIHNKNYFDRDGPLRPFLFLNEKTPFCNEVVSCGPEETCTPSVRYQHSHADYIHYGPGST